MSAWIKKSISVICMCVIALQLAACGSNKGDMAKTDTTTVTIWSPDGHSKSIMENMVDDFNGTIGKEKGIKVIYEVKLNNINQNLEVAFQSDQAPDMFVAGTLEKLVPNDNVVALEDLPGGEEYVAKFKNYVRPYTHTYNGKTYCVPVSTQTRGLIYNKDMFKKAGIIDENGEAKPPETLDEMREDAKKLTNTSTNEYGIILPLKWGGFFDSDINGLLQSSSGGAFDTSTGQFDYSKIVPIMNTYIGFKADGSCYPGADGMDNDPARARFAEGGIGMKISYSWDVGVLNNQFPAKCDWGVAPLPVADKNDKHMQNAWYKDSVKINKKSVDTIGGEKLMEVYKWLTGDDMLVKLYKECAEIPYCSDIIDGVKIEHPQNGWENFADILKISAIPAPSIKTDISGEKTLKEVFVNEVWTGATTPEKAAADYSVVMNNGIKKYASLHPDYDSSYAFNKDWDVRR